jgi:CheY-like chemotaxis protein
MLNKSLSEFLTSPAEFSQKLLLMETGHSNGFKLESQFIAKNGVKLWIEVLVNKYAIVSESLCLIALHDISGHIQLEKEFADNQKRLSDFGYLTSHTLRLPIANIMGLSSLFDEEGLDQHNKSELIANLKTSAFQLNEAVHQLNNVIHSLKYFNEKRTFYKTGRRPGLIMLVDDDIINNFVNKKLIQKFDSTINVVDLTSGQQAITKLQSGLITPDILFLDLSMPIFDGWRFLDELQKQPIHDCRVILLCTTITSNDILRASQYQFVVDVVEKPMNIEKLQTLIYPDQE